MPKPSRRTKQQVEDDNRARAVSDTAFVARDKDGNELGIYDYGEFAGVGSTDTHLGKMLVKVVDPLALDKALRSDPKYRSLPGSAEVLRQARDGDWYRPLRALIRRHGISELPGVTIRYE